MADKKKPATKTPEPAAPKSSGKLGYVTMLVLFGALFPFILPTVVLVMVGMLPTLVALITDKDRDKSGAAAVAAMNAAGVVPFVMDLWVQGQTMADTFHILRDSTTWLVMLGTAGVGQLILISIPPFMTTMSLLGMESRLTTLKSNLDQLKTNWGNDGATTKPLSKIAQID